jgi:hypothetical protein
MSDYKDILDKKTATDVSSTFFETLNKEDEARRIKEGKEHIDGYYPIKAISGKNFELMRERLPNGIQVKCPRCHRTLGMIVNDVDFHEQVRDLEFKLGVSSGAPVIFMMHCGAYIMVQKCNEKTEVINPLLGMVLKGVRDPFPYGRFMETNDKVSFKEVKIDRRTSTLFETHSTKT